MGDWHTKISSYWAEFETSQSSRAKNDLHKEVVYAVCIWCISSFQWYQCFEPCISQVQVLNIPNSEPDTLEQVCHFKQMPNINSSSSWWFPARATTLLWVLAIWANSLWFQSKKRHSLSKEKQCQYQLPMQLTRTHNHSIWSQVLL